MTKKASQVSLSRSGLAVADKLVHDGVLSVAITDDARWSNQVVAGLVAREVMTTSTFLRLLLWGFPLTLVALAISSADVLVFRP